MTTEIANHHKRVITQLCEIVGFKEPDDLLKGGRLRINEKFVVSFIYDEPLSPEHLLVYVDMGPLDGDRAKGLTLFMKINFELGAGARGTMALHPETEHIFYSFRFLLNETASGQDLLDSVLRYLAWLGSEAAHADTETKQDKENAKARDLAAASRAKATRLIQQLAK